MEILWLLGVVLLMLLMLLILLMLLMLLIWPRASPGLAKRNVYKQIGQFGQQYPGLAPRWPLPSYSFPDECVNISLTLAKRFYIYNIRFLLLFAIVIVSLIYKLYYSLTSTRIKLINIYGVSCCLLPISQFLVRVNSIRYLVGFYLKASITGSCKYRRLNAYNCFIDFKLQPLVYKF